TPSATNMKPNWEMVEYASTFLMSVCTTATVAAKKAVSAPVMAMTCDASGACMYRPDSRAIRYTPAVTIVAAWISAETGVGPAIASGNHTYRGICADLPVAPMNNRM